MSIKKVGIFTGTNYIELQKEVNSFMKNISNNHEVIDVKFNSTQIGWDVLIFYKEL